MKTKKLPLLLTVLLVICTVLSGCVNSTYILKLKKNGELDVEYTVRYDTANTTAKQKKYISLMKQKFSDAGYDVKEISDSKYEGFNIKKTKIQKAKISQTGKGFVDDTEYNIDPLDDIMYHMKYNEKARCNTYEIDADIDLSSFLNVPKEFDGKITEDEYKKFLSETNLKLIIELEDGQIQKCNSKNISENKKHAEWLLVPGSKNPIKLKANMGVNTAWISSMIIVGFVIFLTVMFSTIFIKMYRKKIKEHRESEEE